MSKPMSFRLDDEVVKKLDYYSAITGKSKTKFIEDALTRECLYIQQQRAGGINLNIPNPQFNILSDAAKLEILNELKTVDSKNLNLGLGDLIAWLEARFFTDTDIFKQKLAENFYQDVTFENNIKDNMTYIKEDKEV